METTIEQLNDYVQVVNENSKYWMVRTMGGSYYAEFIKDKFIAIGYNDFLLNTIEKLENDGKAAFSSLRNMVAKKYPDNSRPGHIASQLLKFCRELSIGDMILVPSGMSEITIAKITGKVYEDINARDDNRKCPFMKRIPIKIIKRISKFDLAPKALLMFNSRHPISNISNYSMYVDNMVSDFYSKNKTIHVVLKVNTEEDVLYNTFNQLDGLFKIVNNFCTYQGIPYEKDDVTLKIQMESKGCIHFIFKQSKNVFWFALVILFLNGGSVEKGNFKMNTPGIFKALSDYLDRREDRELKESTKKALESMKIETPEDFKKVIIEMEKTQNTQRNKY